MISCIHAEVRRCPNRAIATARPTRARSVVAWRRRLARYCLAGVASRRQSVSIARPAWAEACSTRGAGLQAHGRRPGPQLRIATKASGFARVSPEAAPQRSPRQHLVPLSEPDLRSQFDRPESKRHHEVVDAGDLAGGRTDASWPRYQVGLVTGDVEASRWIALAQIWSIRGATARSLLVTGACTSSEDEVLEAAGLECRRSGHERALIP